MPTQSRAPEKRQRLKELVERLGPAATPAEIREDAYREGIGQVNPHMLIAVRNDLWPERPKHGGGRTTDTTTTLMVSQVPIELLLCPVCGFRSRVRGVYHRLDGSVKRHHSCKQCGHGFATVHVSSERPLHPRRLMAMAATEKECSRCKRILPISCFSKKSNDAHLYRSSCKECLNEVRARLYIRKSLERHMLSWKQYQSMLAEQRNRCAICGTSSPGRNLRGFCIDHCHESGKVRGLLCNKCNLGLGNFDDNLGILEAAVHYLRRS